jgi:hypothetical protein
MALLEIGLLGALIGLAFASSSSSSSSSKGGSDGTPSACATAIGDLPDGLQSIVRSAMASTTLSGDQYETIAQQLDRLADSTSELKLKNAAQVVASCLRAKKGAVAGIPPLDACAGALADLPDVPSVPGGPSLKTIVQSAMLSTALTPAQLETIAQQLDRFADSTSELKLKNAGQVAAACLRAKAKGGGGGGGSVADLTCEQAIKMLSPELQAQILAARTLATPAALNTMATSLEGLAALSSDVPDATGTSPKQRLLLAAKCLKAGTATGTEKGGSTTGAGGPTGIQSPPDKQWFQTVYPGDNASKMTAVVFGSSPPVSRVEELINANNPTDSNGVNLGPVSRTWAAGTPGQTNGVLNWSRLPAGAHLVIPKSWNPWIDTTGHNRGQLTPFPKG